MVAQRNRDAARQAPAGRKQNDEPSKKPCDDRSCGKHHHGVAGDPDQQRRAGCAAGTARDRRRPETNPPGDIPDNQVFIDYTAPAGFSMQVPEGWSRSDTATGVSFADKYGTIDIATAKADKAPTPQSIQQREVPDLVAGGHAVEVTDVRAMTLPAGEAVALDYLSNSAINPVTNRRIRLENRRIYLFHAGQEAIVTFSAPAGADNVDAWKMMAESLRWPS
ncbi:MAG: hypothetical protein ACU0BE_01515 [Paracoccus sp. (in: a-proteobacteria)]